ncbi:histidine phosphatase family protein [Nocardiopsis sp. RSe5-2]|uniref:Histidine phosphatase family protein n=1 Tax=Nocardiopsis endophytica TaxID=3018445 RepID=A0ABT4U9T2_9ACTN|nr:histidine phosphatase family protein [Nocardiopsis endophytica]MDA2813715.1 histidine phosphatase family protein [Nocardiopsis endophytica]
MTPSTDHSTVHLLRHGQSAFNAVYDQTGRDPLIFDAKLTPMGEAQAAAAADGVRRLAPELVVTSPLTRAVQTTLLVTRGLDVPIVVEALHREHLGNSCDIGRPPRALAGDFPGLDFDHLPETWWHAGEPDERGVSVEPEDVLQERVAAFTDWVARRPERSILVVGHAVFFGRLGHPHMHNAELREWRVPASV